MEKYTFDFLRGKNFQITFQVQRDRVLGERLEFNYSVENYRGSFVQSRKQDKYSNVIEKTSEEFVNGFMLVRVENGEFAYIREADYRLLPYGFAFAADFNEHGFAVVGTDRGLTWINRDFCYLSSDGSMRSCLFMDNGSGRLWDGLTSFVGPEEGISTLCQCDTYFDVKIYRASYFRMGS